MSKLKELRERNEISKTDMCKILCMSENSYSKKEGIIKIINLI